MLKERSTTRKECCKDNYLAGKASRSYNHTPVLWQSFDDESSLFIRDLLTKLVNPGILIQSRWIHNPTEISILKTLSLDATFLMLWATTCFVVGVSMQSFIYHLNV